MMNNTAILYKSQDSIMDHETRLHRILDWATTKSGFNDYVFTGIKDYYEEYGHLTTSQEDAIDNVYYKWKIDKWYEKNKKNKNSRA